MFRLFASSFFFLVASLGFSQFPAALADQLQSNLDDRVELYGDHGVSVCVILPDGNEWHGQAGVNGNNDDITESTVFHGASSTKTHVATCMMLLAEEGLVDLDAPWTDYVTLTANFDEEITLRNLIGHTSGIKDYLETGGAAANILGDPNHFWTPVEILEDVVNDTPNFSPGEDFEYSNSNFVLAGLIIETVTGNSLEVELRNRIWDPLGLDDTYLGAYDEYANVSGGVWWNFGSGLQTYNDDPYTSMLSFGYAAGGIVSTSTNQAHFIRNLLQGNVVSAASLEEMMDYSSASFSSWTAGYGLGLHHAVGVGGSEVIGHDGYYSNLSSTFHTNDDCTIATMTNTLTEWYGVFDVIYNTVKNYLITSIAVQPQPSPRAYPQPAGDYLIIDLGSNSSDYKLIDALGRSIVKSISNSNGMLRIDTSDLTPGIFNVLFMDGRTVSFVKE